MQKKKKEVYLSMRGTRFIDVQVFLDFLLFSSTNTAQESVSQPTQHPFAQGEFQKIPAAVTQNMENGQGKSRGPCDEAGKGGSKGQDYSCLLLGFGELKRVKHSTMYNPVQLQSVTELDFMTNYCGLEIVPFNSI